MDKLDPKIILKTPETKWLRLGSVAASLIPIIFGVIIFGSTVSPLFYPIGLTFIIGTILVTCLSVTSVSSESKLGVLKNRWSIIKIGFKWATIVHFFAAILYFKFLLLFQQSVSPNTPMIDEASIMILGVGSIIHVILWVFITFPVSVVCGSIFYDVAMQKE